MVSINHVFKQIFLVFCAYVVPALVARLQASSPRISAVKALPVTRRQRQTASAGKLEALRARPQQQFPRTRFLHRRTRQPPRRAALGAGLPLGAGNRALPQSSLPPRLSVPPATRGRGEIARRDTSAAPPLAVCPSHAAAQPAAAMHVLLRSAYRHHLGLATAGVFRRFVGFDPIDALQPPAEVDVGAARRAERPMACGGRLAADGAAPPA